MSRRVLALTLIRLGCLLAKETLRLHDNDGIDADHKIDIDDQEDFEVGDGNEVKVAFEDTDYGWQGMSMTLNIRMGRGWQGMQIWQRDGRKMAEIAEMVGGGQTRSDFSVSRAQKPGLWPWGKLSRGRQNPPIEKGSCKSHNKSLS